MTTNNTVWVNTDPRETIDKRDSIVIIRPRPAGFGKFEAGGGYVDTKDGYNIFSDFEGYACIDADMKWDSSWWWTRAPFFI